MTTFEDSELVDLSLEEKYPPITGTTLHQFGVDSETARLRFAVEMRAIAARVVDMLADLGCSVDGMECQYSQHRGLFVEVTKGDRYGGIRIENPLNEGIDLRQVRFLAQALTQSTPQE